ncbi:hypothetical protein Tco_0385698 [Tanacetum coccineum]
MASICYLLCHIFLGFTFMISMSSQKFFSWPGTNEEQRNLANISAASEISNLETMPKQMDFLVDIIYHLRFSTLIIEKSLHLRTTRSDVGEGDKANIYNNSHAFEEDVASAVELAKARSRGRTTILGEVDSEYVLLNSSKILEHLERTSPKEKNSSSRLAGTTEKSANELTKSNHQIPLIVLSSMNGNSTSRVKGSAPTTNASSTLALPAEPRQKKRAFQMSVHEYFEVLDDDNHSTARVQGNAPTTNAASTLALPAEPPQKKPAFQMSVPEDFDVLDDDNHSTAPVQVNAPTTYAARSLALPRIYLEYDDPPQKKLRLSFSYNQ